MCARFEIDIKDAAMADIVRRARGGRGGGGDPAGHARAVLTAADAAPRLLGWGYAVRTAASSSTPAPKRCARGPCSAAIFCTAAVSCRPAAFTMVARQGQILFPPAGRPHAVYGRMCTGTKTCGSSY